MTSIPDELSAPHVVVFCLLLALVCWAYLILLFRFDFEPLDSRKTRHWIKPYDLFISLGFVLAVSGLFLLLVRLPSYLVFPEHVLSLRNRQEQSHRQSLGRRVRAVRDRRLL